jgi:hypothetical protein
MFLSVLIHIDEPLKFTAMHVCIKIHLPVLPLGVDITVNKNTASRSSDKHGTA